jgi:hypothetical protein
MDDEIVDLRGSRQRLVKLGVAAGVGLVVTIVAMWLIDLVGVEPGSDPVGAGTPGLLAIFIFIVSTAAASTVLGRKRS